MCFNRNRTGVKNEAQMKERRKEGCKERQQEAEEKTITDLKFFLLFPFSLIFIISSVQKVKTVQQKKRIKTAEIHIQQVQTINDSSSVCLYNK